MTTDEQANVERKKRFGAKIGWAIYKQIAAIIGAFALLAFVTTLFDIGWSGVLAALIGAWDDYVRPPVQFLFHHLVEIPFGWIGWDVEVPQLVQDYFAVGFVLIGSFVRADVSTGEGRSLRDAVGYFLIPDWDDWGGVLLEWAPIVILLWPLAFALNAFAAAIRFLEEASDEAWEFVQRISPLIYAGVLLALNYLVL